jgi:hypothetical protein
MALPCFSFIDTGLNKKKPDQWCGYVPIGSRTSPEHAENGPYQGLCPPLGVQTIYEGIYNIRERTVVHFTSPISNRLTQRVMITRKLWLESFMRLRELYSQSQRLRLSIQESGPPKSRSARRTIPYSSFKPAI